MPNAIISVSDKSNLDILCPFLLEKNYTIYSTGGTYTYIRLLTNNSDSIKTIESLTQFPEILNGRVKTLHPIVYGGLLADLENNSHREDLEEHNLISFDLVVVNLYPFEKNNTIENIDIGGVSLIRASSKNYKHITLLSNPTQYDYFTANYPAGITLDIRRELAYEGFKYTSQYDKSISNFLSFNNKSSIINLKYGANPHQIPAYIEYEKNKPFTIINGLIGYINVLDIIHGWLIVREIEDITRAVSFISMKHTSPAGLGSGTNISSDTLDIFGVDESIRDKLTPCAIAFIKSRNCDPLSSFGDFICCSSKVDVMTAKLIKKEVCDGIVAIDFEDEALDILLKKKGGKFIIIKMDMYYYEYYRKNGWNESKEIYGITLNQPYNDYIYNMDSLEQLENKHIDMDSVIAYSVLKYSQSNNVSMVYNGQLIGIGCGQQNRVACVKLAGEKALIWRLRHSPKVIEYYKQLSKDLKRQEKINLVYKYINDNRDDLMTDLQKITEITPITLGSDGFFPFTDNIVEANRYGVKKIIQPGGSIADRDVIDKCIEYNIMLENVGKRMFYH